MRTRSQVWIAGARSARRHRQHHMSVFQSVATGYPGAGPRCGGSAAPASPCALTSRGNASATNVAPAIDRCRPVLAATSARKLSGIRSEHLDQSTASPGTVPAGSKSTCKASSDVWRSRAAGGHSPQHPPSCAEVGMPPAFAHCCPQPVPTRGWLAGDHQDPLNQPVRGKEGIQHGHMPLNADFGKNPKSTSRSDSVTTISN